MDSSITNFSLGDLKDNYAEDLPNPSSFESEFHLWKCKCSSYSLPSPSTPTNALVYATPDIFPNIHCLMHLVCTIPISSCECERSVSVLYRLKSFLQSAIGQDRLSGLAGGKLWHGAIF